MELAFSEYLSSSDINWWVIITIPVQKGAIRQPNL